MRLEHTGPWATVLVMLKLKRLRVERFRSLARGAELSFSDGINVVLGQNGTGKTTLLELISMVVCSDFSSLTNEEFAFEYELSSPEGENIIVTVQNERTGEVQVDLGARDIFRISAEILGGADHRRLFYYDPERGVSVGDEPPQSSAHSLGPEDRGFLVSSLVKLPNLFQRFGPSLIAATNTPRFDESLDLFRRITGTGDPIGNLTVAPDRLFSNPFVSSLAPRSLVQRLQRLLFSEAPHKADYSFSDGELDFLAVLKDMMGFNTSELRVDVTKPSVGSDAQIGNLLFRFRWSDGTFITHERLSYGQKRLLTFFYYLASNEDTVIADELVNGLHHRWITASIAAIEQRQAFLTSQNPLLLDYIPITSVEEVRRSFVLCRAEPRVGGRPGWIWENMSEENAAELFSAYQVGVEHVSEILQSRGLW